MSVENKATINYFKSLLGRVFKILPLYEDIESRKYLFKYIQSLLYEFEGLPNYMNNIKASTDFIIIHSTLEEISNESLFDDNNTEFIKSEIFKCINLIKRILKSVGDCDEH